MMRNFKIEAIRKFCQNKRAAVLVEFSIILLPLTWFMIAATDVAMYFVAKQQVSGMANIATFYAANRGITNTNFAAIVKQSIMNPMTDSDGINITNSTYTQINKPDKFCGCSATVANSATACLTNADAGYKCNITYNSKTFAVGQGSYTAITATARYPVLFPTFWQVVMGQTPVNGKLLISTTSYLRIQ